MNKLSFVLFLMLLLASIGNIFADNNEVTSHHYQTVVVETGDTVWNIAAKHSSSQEDIRNLIVAIRQVNHLDHSVQIYPGQTLHIPVKDNYSGWASLQQIK